MLNNVLYADLTGVFLVVGCTLFISLVNCLSEIPIFKVIHVKVILCFEKGKDHRVNYTTGRNLCNGRNLVELVAVKCTTPVMEYDV